MLEYLPMVSGSEIAFLTTNFLAASAAKVEESAAVVEAQNKAGDDAEVQKAEENLEMVERLSQ